MFKRNQVEEGISRVLEQKKDIGDVLLTRLKRLMDADRTTATASHRKNKVTEKFAFFSAPPPGTGNEVQFTDYDAFALLNGIRFMAYGWSQSFAVSILRRCRKDLEPAHGRILKMDPAAIFDEAAIRKSAKAGDIGVDTTHPVFLTIVSRGADGSAQDELLECAVCEGADKAMRWAWSTSKGLHSLALFELTNVAHRLASELRETQPAKRGRGA